MMYNKLKRVGKGERRIFGVCGGISRFIDPDLDPVLIRITWIVLTLFSPVMIVLYLALALALKVDDAPYEFDSSKYVKESKDVLEVKIDGKEVDVEDIEEAVEKKTEKDSK